MPDVSDSDAVFGLVDLSKITPLAGYRGEDADETRDVRDLAHRAVRFLMSFDWCNQVLDVFVGDVTVDKLLAVFMCRIVPKGKGVDDLLWTIVGDLPPAYIAVDEETRNPASAVDAYLGEIQRWISAIRASAPVGDLMPVLTADGDGEIAPTEENADQLERRLHFIDGEILAHHADDLRRSPSEPGP